MSWQEGVAVAVVLPGLGARVFLVAQRPSFRVVFSAVEGAAPEHSVVSAVNDSASDNKHTVRKSGMEE